MESKAGKAFPSFARGCLIFLVALGVLVLFIVVHAAAISQPHRLGIPSLPKGGGLLVQENPSGVVAAFEEAVNSHDVEGALGFFTDDAIVTDSSNIACLYGPIGIRCQPYELSYAAKVQIRGWLQLLAAENIQVQESGALQSIGNNVTWTWQVSVDEYRRLNVAPLVGTGFAIVQGDMIKYLKFILSLESVARLQSAFSAARQSPYSVAAGGFAVGVIALGLVFPGVAVYYVSRVKKLFAAVPKLDRPWILLGTGVGSLFLAVLLVALRDVAGVPTTLADPLFDLVLAVCTFQVMSAMILMKRVMISEPHE